MDHQASRFGLDPAMTEGPRGASVATAKPPLIAVVDDDPAVCGSLKFALELEGFAVRTYHSGGDLLRSDDLEEYNCFVVDQRIPGMTGMELIEVLRARRVLTPVIAARQPGFHSSRDLRGQPHVEAPVRRRRGRDSLRRCDIRRAPGKPAARANFLEPGNLLI